MLKKVLIAAVGGLMAMSALAADQSKVDKSIELKDGSTVYIFKDGKMGMENKLGRVEAMKAGHVMETKDGKKIVMIGNEVWRLEELLHGSHNN